MKPIPSFLKKQLKQETHKSEHQEQAGLVAWCREAAKFIPAFEMLFAIPNGGKLSGRQKVYKWQEGVEAGIPDLMLAVSRSGYHGLFIEMKVKPHGATSKDQKKWIARLRRESYRVEVAWTQAEAQAIICDYLKIKGLM